MSDIAKKIIEESAPLMKQWGLSKLEEGLSHESALRLIPELSKMKGYGEASIGDLEFDTDKWKRFVKKARGKEEVVDGTYLVFFPGAVMSAYDYFPKDGYSKRVGIEGDKAAVKRVFNNLVNNAESTGSVYPKSNGMISVPRKYFEKFPEYALAKKVGELADFSSRLDRIISDAKEIDKNFKTKYTGALEKIKADMDKKVASMGGA